MSTILTRTFSGAIYVALMLGSVFLGPYFFGAVQLFFLFLCLAEYQKMYSNTDFPIGKISFLTAGLMAYFIVILYLWDFWDKRYLWLILLIVLKFTIYELFLENKHPLLHVGIVITGLIYIVLPFSLLNFFFYPVMNSDESSVSLLSGFFIIIWGNDTFAYLSGMAFGRHKLFERISPKKTWEGAIGGAVFAIISSVVFSYFYSNFSILAWMGYAFTIIIFGTFGDLFESLMKRSLGLKDSGSIMPGHGGILDRFDSILMAVPFAYIYIVFVLN